MALDVYFREDVAQVLDAVDMASGGTVALVNEEVTKAMRAGRQLDNEELSDHLRIYRQGFRDALAAVAVAFGILPRSYTLDSNANGQALPRDDAFRLPVWER